MRTSECRYSGNVAVMLEGIEASKIYSTYEYFGERSLMTEEPVFADCVAQTDVVVYSMEKNKFLSFISGTDFEDTLKKVVTPPAPRLAEALVRL